MAYNNNHRMNMSFNYQIDSFTTLIVAPNLDYSATSSLSETHGITRTPDGDMVNSSDMFNRSAMKNLNFRNNFSLVRLLNREGRSISMEFGQQYSRNKVNLFVNSENHFVEDGVDREELTDQHTRSNGDTRGLSGSLTYIEPLGKAWRMEASYNFNYALSNSDRQTYNLNSGTGKYEDIDSAYSNKFRSVNVMQKPQLVFNYNTQKFNVALGGGIQMNTLKNYSYTQDDSINLYQTSFVPTSRISYNVSQQLRVSADYYFYANQPTTDQLQPVPDNTNTLFKRVGNPDLKTAFNHNINLRMDGFVPQKGFNYAVNIGYSPIANAIVNEVSYDKNFVQTTRPINVSGNYNINTYSYISKSIKKKIIPGALMATLTVTTGKV
ncbi:outer membrane beta-barrel family protein [Chitinophaga sedimenti]|uniref:outer membrane beta-barrel protein n=1 Tax=Chitinophaga sedimenti TaxID=2033606 RepID=UPI0020069E55|nr:outer membrane beta-barrel protein [Chitinophaga sedimenti]MCK7560200.1 outer membrane beta-barrel family protein [Chitinophaga sedimenti]